MDALPVTLLTAFEVAIMSALPEPTAVTTPVAFTTATFVSLDDQVTLLSVASEGVIVAEAWVVTPKEAKEVLASVTEQPVGFTATTEEV